jgi:hypothetical protein
MPDDIRERIARAIERAAEGFTPIHRDGWSPEADAMAMAFREAARIARETPPEADREALIAMLERAGLRRSAGVSPGCNEYAIDGRRIVLGQGDGWSRSEARFRFDVDGNLENYGLLE